MDDKAIATVNLDMLDHAVEEDQGGSKSIMDSIHTLKIYNPRIGDPIEEDKAGKFKLKVANTGEEIFFEGTVLFNPLSISYFWSGSIYPILDNGQVASEKIFFTTNEFGKYAKKTDTVGLAAKGKPLGFFGKEEFEKMIKTRSLNGQDNQFYDRKKDKDGKPFDGTLLNKGAIIYGKFLDGLYKGEFFRYFTSVKNLGVTFRDGEVVEPDVGTFEYAVNQGLDPLNGVLENNGRRRVNRIEPTQVDLRLSIFQNEKKNFMPCFDYEELVAVRGADNQEDQHFIHNLKAEHFMSIFGAMGEPTQILIDGTSARATLSRPQLSAPKTGEMSVEEIAALPDFVKDEPLEYSAKEVFNKDLTQPDF